MPSHWAILLLSVCGVLLCAVVMPSMMMSQIEFTTSHQKVVVNLPSGRSHMAGSKPRLDGSTRGHQWLYSKQELSLQEPQQQPKQQPERYLTWETFWGSDFEHGKRNTSL